MGRRYSCAGMSSDSSAPKKRRIGRSKRSMQTHAAADSAAAPMTAAVKY